MNRLYFGELGKSAPSELDEESKGFRQDVLKDMKDIYGETSGRLNILP